MNENEQILSIRSGKHHNTITTPTMWTQVALDYGAAHNPASKVFTILKKNPNLRAWFEDLAGVAFFCAALPRCFWIKNNFFSTRAWALQAPQPENYPSSCKVGMTGHLAVVLCAAMRSPKHLDRIPRGGKALATAFVDEGVLPSYHEFYDAWNASHPQHMEVARISRIAEEKEAKKRKRLAKKEQKTIDAINEALDTCSYRVSCSSWAGGDHERVIMPTIKKPNEKRNDRDLVGGCFGRSNRVYSTNRKWSGNDSAHHLQVRSDWEKHIPKNRRTCTYKGNKCLVLDIVSATIVGPQGLLLQKALIARPTKGFGIEATIVFLDANGKTRIKGSVLCPKSNAYKSKWVTK